MTTSKVSYHELDAEGMILQMLVKHRFPNWSDDMVNRFLREVVLPVTSSDDPTAVVRQIASLAFENVPPEEQPSFRVSHECHEIRKKADQIVQECKENTEKGLTKDQCQQAMAAQLNACIDKSTMKGKLVCVVCNKPNQIIVENDETHNLIKRCGKCLQYLYCSKECQIQHWPQHKVVCKKS